MNEEKKKRLRGTYVATVNRQDAWNKKDDDYMEEKKKNR